MNALKKITALLLLIATLTLSLAGCNKNPLKEYEEDTGTEQKDYYYVAMAIKNYGTIIVKLDAKQAPKTTANFVKLVREGFYDGLTFHRVMKNFMIQGGDPEANGYGGSDQTIDGEFISNGYYNPIPFERGTIAMARGNDPDSASSQFFICNANSSNVQSLYGDYAAFGQVVEGMDVVDAITRDTAGYGNSSGTIEKKSKQAVITEMKVIIRDLDIFM